MKPAISEEPPLELDLPAPAAAHAALPRRSARVRRRLVVGVIAAAAVALLALLAVRLFGPVRHEPPGPMLRVDSEPEGAEVWLGGESLGMTPYVGDNDLPPGNYSVRLELSGFRSWSGSFEGGRDAHLKARLRPTSSR